MHCPRRDAEDLCRLSVSESTEETALDDSAQSRIDGLESIERVVDRENFVGAILDGDRCFIEAYTPLRSASFGGEVAPCVIDEHTPHCVCGNAHHARRILPLDLGLLGEAEVGLVYEARRVERMPGSLVTELSTRELSELLVDPRKDLVEVGCRRLRARIRVRFGLRHHRRSVV